MSMNIGDTVTVNIGKLYRIRQGDEIRYINEDDKNELSSLGINFYLERTETQFRSGTVIYSDKDKIDVEFGAAIMSFPIKDERLSKHV